MLTDSQYEANPWVKFSPFYPHGKIPIPLSPGYTAASVEGIWQGLKVFTKADVCDYMSCEAIAKELGQ